RLSLDLLGGTSVGAVGQSVIAVPVFNKYVVKGSGAAAGGICLGVAVHPKVLFSGEVALLDGGHHDMPNIVVSGTNGVFTVQTYTRALVYDASVEAMFWTGNHILGKNSV